MLLVPMLQYIKCRLHAENFLCAYSKSVSAKRQSNERSKRDQQNRRQVDRERDADYSSRDSDYDRPSACDRQMVCLAIIISCM